MRSPRQMTLFFAALALGGCGYTEQEWQVQLDKSQRLEARVAAAETASDKAVADAKQAEERTVAIANRLRSMGIDVDALENTERLMAEHHARGRAVRNLEDHASELRAGLRQVIQETGANVLVKRRRLLIEIPADALFGAGKKTISKKAEPELRQIAAVLAQPAWLKGKPVEVVGHTEMKPGGDPIEISVLRARAVASFLASDKGGKLPPGLLSATGRGDGDPVAPPSSPDAAKRNRRVDIVVLSADDEGP